MEAVLQRKNWPVWTLRLSSLHGRTIGWLGKAMESWHGMLSLLGWPSSSVWPSSRGTWLCGLGTWRGQAFSFCWCFLLWGRALALLLRCRLLLRWRFLLWGRALALLLSCCLLLRRRFFLWGRALALSFRRGFTALGRAGSSCRYHVVYV